MTRRDTTADPITCSCGTPAVRHAVTLHTSVSRPATDEQHDERRYSRGFDQ